MSDEKRGRGRPRKHTLISLDQALELIAEYRARFGKRPLSRAYLYNCIHAKKIENFGQPGMAVVAKEQILETFCKIGIAS